MQGRQNLRHLVRSKPIEDHLPIATRCHKLQRPQLAQMLAEGRLGEPNTLNQFVHAQLGIQQVAEDQQPLGIGHRPQQFGGLVGTWFKLCDIHIDTLEYTNICVNNIVITREFAMSNVGTVDRIVRFLIGLALILVPFVSGWAIFSNMLWTIVSIIVGLVLVATAAFGSCPIYAALGLSSKRR